MPTFSWRPFGLSSGNNLEKATYEPGTVRGELEALRKDFNNYVLSVSNYKIGDIIEFRHHSYQELFKGTILSVSVYKYARNYNVMYLNSSHTIEIGELQIVRKLTPTFKGSKKKGKR